MQNEAQVVGARQLLLSLLLAYSTYNSAEAGTISIFADGSGASLNGILYGESSNQFGIARNDSDAAQVGASLVTGTVSSAASLSGAFLKSTASLSSVNGLGELVFQGGVLQSFASLIENLEFTVDGASPDQITTIGVRIALEGTLTVPESGGSASATFSALIASQNAQLGGTDSIGLRLEQHPNVLLQHEVSGFLLNSANVWEGTLDLIGPVSQVGINLDLSCKAFSNGDCSFGNSARFTFAPLPLGVSFVSESGVFLTAVPVPAAALLLGSALGCLGFIRRCAA